MVFDTNIMDVLHTFSYLGIFIWFVLFDVFIPLPEELVLLSIGYASSAGYINPFIAGFLVVLAFFIVDNTFFYLAKVGQNIIKRFNKKVGKETSSIYKKKMREHTPKTLFALTFIPRLRVLGPILAGIVKVEKSRFMLYDALALCVYVTFYTFLGYVFHSSFRIVMEELGRLETLLIYAAMIAVAAFSLFLFNKRHLNHARN